VLINGNDERSLVLVTEVCRGWKERGSPSPAGFCRGSDGPGSRALRMALKSLATFVGAGHDKAGGFRARHIIRRQDRVAQIAMQFAEIIRRARVTLLPSPAGPRIG